MKISTTQYLLVAVIIALAACTDQEPPKASQKEGSFQSAVQPIESVQQKVALTSDIPKEIKGFPFEVGGKCAVDYANKPAKEQQTVTINIADGLTVDGWAFDDKNENSPSIAVLQLASGQQRYHAVMMRHGGREDLTKAFGSPEYTKAGYRGVVDISKLPLGNYDMLIIQKSNNKNLVCSTYRKLEINQ
jgi:hypothetical protein